ncbi:MULTISPECIES: LamG domain-containing protein [unclassified Anaeromyxobacter]|uniref:LamG domain-containing protein n=1 Tax=unclassified Anaeromyxobacter TaxID=2620896 RepID=UPI001F584622|nr:MULTISPECIES: LamG domain-containing protein [unclassified Anaeromyxobacter]
MLLRPRTLALLALALVLPAVATAQARSIDPYGRPSASPVSVELDRGLVASYPLDGDAVDRVTRRPARVVGARPLEGHDGRPRGALWFDGARAWVVLGDALQLPRFTIAAWIRPDATDRVMAIVSKIRNLPGHYEKNLELRLDPGGRLFLHVPGGGDWDAAQGQRALEPGRWVHVAATYDGRRAQLWVDGVRDGAPLEVAYAQTRTETFIGARPEGGGRDGRTPAGPTFAFQGGIEDVNFWDRALGDAELLAVAGRAPPRWWRGTRSTATRPTGRAAPTARSSARHARRRTAAATQRVRSPSPAGTTWTSASGRSPIGSPSRPGSGPAAPTASR